MSRIKKEFLDIELRKKGVHSHGFPENHENHVWRQDSAEERSEGCFRSSLLQAYINHNHDKNSLWKNPNRYHSQVEKSGDHICSR